MEKALAKADETVAALREAAQVVEAALETERGQAAAAAQAAEAAAETAAEAAEARLVGAETAMQAADDARVALMQGVHGRDLEQAQSELSEAGVELEGSQRRVEELERAMGDLGRMHTAQLAQLADLSGEASAAAREVEEQRGARIRAEGRASDAEEQSCARIIQVEKELQEEARQRLEHEAQAMQDRQRLGGIAARLSELEESRRGSQLTITQLQSSLEGSETLLTEEREHAAASAVNWDAERMALERAHAAQLGRINMEHEAQLVQVRAHERGHTH